MEERLVALLLSSAGLTALVGQDVHWGRAPQGLPAPFVVLQRIDGNRNYHMRGPSGLVSSRVQVDVYDAEYTASKKIARTVGAALSGHRDTFFQGIFLDGERDLPAADAGEVKNLFRTSLDFMIHHTE